MLMSSMTVLGIRGTPSCSLLVYCTVYYVFFLKLVFNFAISMLKILLNNRLLAYKT